MGSVTDLTRRADIWGRVGAKGGQTKRQDTTALLPAEVQYYSLLLRRRGGDQLPQCRMRPQNDVNRKELERVRIVGF